MHVHLVGDPAQHVQVGLDAGDVQRRAERARPALPVHERARLLRHRRHREHHVGAVGDRARPQFQADHERRGRQGRAGGRRGRAGRPGPRRAITSASMSPAAAAARICEVSRPGTAGSDATPQARATSTRACELAARRPPGSRFGSAPASMAPRSPARRGIQASRAPVARASRSAALSAPGTSASRSPTRMIGAVGGQRLGRRAAGLVQPGAADQAAQRGGLGARARWQQDPGHPGQPAAGQRGDGVDGQGARPGRLAQPEEHDGRLVVRLEPGQQHHRCPLQVGVADLDVAASHVGGEELGLLGRVRPGPHVDVVACPARPGRTWRRRRRPRR